MVHNALIIFARAPAPGRVKTRLASVLGDEATLALYRAFLADLGRRLGHDPRWQTRWVIEPTGEPFPDEIAEGLPVMEQRGGDLGERMRGAFVDALADGHEAVVLIGSDVPELAPERIAEAFAALERGRDLVLGPAFDGGYVLIGARRVPEVFDGIRWGTSEVLAATIVRAEHLGLTVELLPASHDVDRIEDVERLARDLAGGAGNALPATQRALAHALRSVGARLYARGAMASEAQPNDASLAPEPREPLPDAPDVNSPAVLWADFKAAVRALTILGRRPEAFVERVGRAGLFYPLVGLAIGALLTIIDTTVRNVITQELTSIFLVAALAIVSVGRHLDGFANTADGLIGFRGREWALAIMRDRRLGTFGTAAIIFLITLKVRGYDLIGEQIRVLAVLLPPMLGRWSMVVLAHGSREAMASGEPRRFDPAVGFREFAVASVITFLVAFAAGEALGLVVVIVIAALTVALRLYFHRRLGGVNEHSLGAIAEITETVALLIFVLAS